MGIAQSKILDLLFAKKASVPGRVVFKIIFDMDDDEDEDEDENIL